MSLLDKAGRENVVVYQEVLTTDADGNIMYDLAPGVPATATIQMLAQSGTSQRRAEQTNEGFESEQNYRLRFPRSFTMILGMQAMVDWNGFRWSVIGKVHRYNGSSRTRHVDYIIRRA